MPNRLTTLKIITGAIIHFCLAAVAVGQSLVLPKSPLQQRTTGGNGQDELLSLTVNWRGDIAAIGNSARGDQGGQDICFVAFDAQLNKLVERNIGRKADDGAGQIAALPDGRYLVAGFSTRPGGKSKTRANYFGKRDGWLLVLNERGETEREILLGTASDDAFVSVAASPDGSVWLAGNSEGQAWILKLNPQLEVVWEKRARFRQLPTNVAAATLSPSGAFFVVGGMEELDRNHLWVAGFDADGQQIMEQIYPTSQAEMGTSIVALDAKRLAIVGTVDNLKGREDGFLSILNSTGVMLHYQVLGGREFDRVHTLTRLHNGRLLAAGGSASFERGSRRISAWLALLDDSAKIRQEEYYGSKLDDEALALLEHPDGRVFAVGVTARQVLKMRQGWLFQLSERTESKSKPEALQATLGAISDPAGQSFVTNERVFLPFSIENQHDKGQSQLRAVVSAPDAATAQLLRLPSSRSVLIPTISAGERLDWGMPLQFVENCPAGVYRYTVQFFQGDKKVGEPMPFEVNVGQDAVPRLSLKINAPDSGLVAGQEGFLNLELHNLGTGTAYGLTLSTTVPEGVRLRMPTMLSDLAPGEKISHRLAVLPENISVGEDALRVQARVSDGSLLHTASTELRVAVRPKPTQTKLPEKPNYTVAVWVYPNPDNFDRKEIVWTQEEIVVQIKVVSSQPVARQQFCLEINGQDCPMGQKFDEVQIKGDRTSKTFSQTVRLREGENVLRATVQGQGGGIQGEALKIFYTPAKPNLHIVSIGVPTTDLKYTGKDARDFAQALASSQNAAFGKIFLDTLLSEERTTKTEMLKVLRRLQYRYADLQILPKDLLVVFVSGHGLGTYDGGFRLAASDYDGPFVQETSLDFEHEMVNYLQSLPCQKLFFVDACHSGTAAGTGLAGIATRKNGLSMLASCQSDEYSYEDDAWQNGAFTRALVQGIGSFAEQPLLLDRNRDSALDLSELFFYVQKEVPSLVEKKKPKTKTPQHPSLFLAEKERSVILFEIKKR